MIDIRLIREDSKSVKENIKKKFQDEKLILIDQILNLMKNGENLNLKEIP